MDVLDLGVSFSRHAGRCCVQTSRLTKCWVLYTLVAPENVACCLYDCASNTLASTHTICTLSTVTSGAWVVEAVLVKLVLNLASDTIKVQTYKQHVSHHRHLSTSANEQAEPDIRYRRIYSCLVFPWLRFWLWSYSWWPPGRTANMYKGHCSFICLMRPQRSHILSRAGFWAEQRREGVSLFAHRVKLHSTPKSETSTYKTHACYRQVTTWIAHLWQDLDRQLRSYFITLN